MGWRKTIKGPSWKDTISEDYGAPEQREKPTTLPGLSEQEDAASIMLDTLKVGGHGASLGISDEAIAGLKTGSLSSSEYMNERNTLRNEMQASRDNVGIAAPVVEAVGSLIPTMAAGAIAPAIKAAPFLTEMVSAAIQGFGEAPEMADVPESVGWSMGVQGASEVVGKGVKAALFNNPTKILSKSVGSKGTQVKLPGERSIQKSVSRLDNSGFFKQGAASVSPQGQVWKRSGKTLKEVFQPQSLDSLYKRSTDSLSVLKDTNNKLIQGKKVPFSDFDRTLKDGVHEMSYDPEGFDLIARSELAQGVVDTIKSDMVSKGAFLPGAPILAKDIEIAKKSLDKHVGSPAFKKRAEDLGINPEALVLFRQKLDGLVDSVGGIEYKKNNDLMSDLINVKEAIETKLNREYIDTGSGIIDNRDWKTKLVEGFSPTPVDIVRSDIARGGPGVDAMGRVIKRTPQEMFTEQKSEYPVSPRPQNGSGQGMFQNVKPAFPFDSNPQEQVRGLPGRNPNSVVGMTPAEVARTRLPRTTEGLLQNKELVLAKLAVNGVPDEMIATVAQALNDSPEDIGSVASLVATQFPTIFEKSKYQMFDGKLLNPQERAKAADDTSKRDDLNSLQKAKIINELNKSGRWLGE